MHVRPAESEADLDEVRRLFRAFLSWHRQRHVSDLELIDAYFDDAAYDREIDGLPGAYAPPDGCLLACWEKELALGCVAYQRLDAESCGMKRMFVPTTARGRGAGRALADELLTRAKTVGYRAMYLDTSVRQTEAITLYRDLGFTEVEPYYDVPEEMRGWLTFFRLDL
ncbi:GNAT family N-acetyltransferase [Nocardioides sp.]|jgi:GNAT superfamily N-acetyltransferase|uniref:GNAT family N-acetyltransferase n=1 Tax=Nocardioides sp. TaxID=35761 RepID=UPI002F410AF8